MKVLFISYFFHPSQLVGAKRLTYWAINAGSYGIDSEVITACEQNDDIGIPVHYVPNNSKVPFLNKFIKDQGLAWKDQLLNYMQTKMSNDFDVIIISGGPFMQMRISEDIRKRTKSKIILDYRDPFAVNPRFDNSSIKIAAKKFYEKKFNKYAHKIITVNKYCADLIVADNEKISVIDNGFDETEINSVQRVELSENRTNLIYTGKLSSDRNPKNLLRAIDQYFSGSVVFHHFGNDHECFVPYIGKAVFNYHGTVPYKFALDNIFSADICVIITSGMPYESTTKIFDYIALNKKVLIITEGKEKTGNLHEITKDYPNILWCQNDVDNIKYAIEKLKDMEIIPFDASGLSRKAGLEKLVDLLKEYEN